MEFGRVSPRELNKIDFTLPREPAFNKKALKGKSANNPGVYVGCAKWGRPEWVGKIYPPKTKEKDFLEHYVQHYNAIELNATHYKVYKEDVIRKWKEKAQGRDFLFAPKLYKGISHFGRLEDKQRLTDDVLAALTAFEENLGPIFIQVGDNFSVNRKVELFDYLKTLPTDLNFFVEVRHPTWFEPVVQDELFQNLRKLKIGAVITDTAGRRDCCHMHVTIPKTFIRYVGNSLHKTDFTRCDAWVKRIKYWLDNGMQEIYFFMHMHDEATSPELSAYLVDKLNKTCGLDLPVPKFINKKPLEKALKKR